MPGDGYSSVIHCSAVIAAASCQVRWKFVNKFQSYNKITFVLSFCWNGVQICTPVEGNSEICCPKVFICSTRPTEGRYYGDMWNLRGNKSQYWAACDYFNVSVCTATRGHPYKLFLTRCFTDVRKYFFCNRVVKIWNELPSDTDFTCINYFKRRLTRINLNIYCDHD